MTSAEQFQALDSRKIDLGFTGLMPAAGNEGLVFERVTFDTILVALPARHPLAKKSKLRLTDLASYFFIGMAEKTHPGARKWLLATCESSGFTAKILQEADSEPAAIKFVAAGLGVALMPDQIADLKHDGVTFHTLSPPLRREAAIAWREDNPSKPLRDYIRIVKDLSGGEANRPASKARA